MKSETIKNYAIALAVLIAALAYGLHYGQQALNNHRFSKAQTVCGRQNHNAAKYEDYNICMTWQGYGSSYGYNTPGVGYY